MAEVAPPNFLSDWTIARRISIAFAAMGLVSLGLVVMTLFSIGRATTLAEDAHEDFAPGNFARAAVTDFNRMRAAVLREGRIETPLVEALHKSFRQDLDGALRSLDRESDRAIVADLKQAETAWLKAAKQVGADRQTTPDEIARLDDAADTLDRGVERLVTVMEDSASKHRDAAKLSAAIGVAAVFVGAVAVGIVALLAAFALTRGIKAPLGRAVSFASEIADGRLDAVAPKSGRDELSHLISVIAGMRDRIKSMLDEQVRLRQSSEMRLSEAVEGSQEGLIVADARGVIQIANRQALSFLGLSARNLGAGASLDTIRKLVGLYGHSHRAMLEEVGEAGADTAENLLPDGRRIQNSRHRTSEGGFVGLYTDVTALVSQRETLAAAKATLDAAMTTMSQALCVFDAQHRLKLANRQAYALFGFTPEEAVAGMTYLALLDLGIAKNNHPGRDAARLKRHERFVTSRRRRITRHVPFGRDRILAVSHEPMDDGGWLGTYEDVTERRRAEARIAHLATHDGLTGLANRIALQSQIDNVLSGRRFGAGCAILCLGLDGFKEINDTLGHAVGDALLRDVSERFKLLMRRSDLLVRLGGDEFAIVRSDIATRDDAQAFAATILRSLRTPFTIEGRNLTIAATGGMVLAPEHGSCCADLLKNADLALNKAKEDARGTILQFEPELQDALNARILFENDLRMALTNGEFEMHYQPLLDLASMEIRGFEALMRWNHPLRGSVSPVQFIPAAERVGLIDALGIWALEQACRAATTWPATVKVAVNVSVAQLRDGMFAAAAQRALRMSGLAPERLELELTESVFMSNAAQITQSLMVLKDMGVRFAMDDFGTGYSSLSYLRRFAFDKIKIDRSFLQNLQESVEAEQIIRTIVALGRNLGMRVTAEGVETPRQFKFLSEIGCDEIQGYLIGRPQAASEVWSTLVEHNGLQTMRQSA